MYELISIMQFSYLLTSLLIWQNGIAICAAQSNAEVIAVTFGLPRLQDFKKDVLWKE